MDVETLFFEALSEVKKDLEDISAGIGTQEVCWEFDIKSLQGQH
jgi:hypothetical protein